MKFHVWMLLLLSILASCSTVRLPTAPIETPTETIETPSTPVVETPTLPTSPTEPDETEISYGPSTGSEPIGPEYELPNMRKVFTVKVENTNYSKYEGAKAKLDQAEKLIDLVMNSKEYEEEVLNFTHKGVKTFYSNNGLTNAQIYEKLYAGAEALIPAVNYQLDLKVTMYYSNNKTVGYTYPSSMIVNTNWKFHKNYQPCRIASNIVHEWTHKMGFGHSSNYTSNRDFTVPYGHNDIIERLCEKAEKNQLTQK